MKSFLKRTLIPLLDIYSVLDTKVEAGVIVLRKPNMAYVLKIGGKVKIIRWVQSSAINAIMKAIQNTVLALTNLTV